MLFDRLVGRVVTETISPSAATPAATKYTLARTSGRFAVEIQAKSGTAYVGGSDVTSENGIAIKEGESRVFPVNNSKAIYVIGTTVTIADFYDG